jgi:hypothetical protein
LISTEQQRGESPPARQTSLLEALVRRWIPAALCEDDETRHRAISTVLFSLSMAVWGVVFAPINAILGSHRSAVTVLMAAVACILNVLSLKAHASLRLTGNLTAAIVLLTLLVLSAFTGGFQGPAPLWLPSVPIIAILLCSWRIGFSGC